MKGTRAMEWVDLLFDMDDMRAMYTALVIIAVPSAIIAGIITGLAIAHHGLLMMFANGQGPFLHILCAGGTFIGAFILAIIAEIMLAKRAYRRGASRRS